MAIADYNELKAGLENKNNAHAVVISMSAVASDQTVGQFFITPFGGAGLFPSVPTAFDGSNIPAGTYTPALSQTVAERYLIGHNLRKTTFGLSAAEHTLLIDVLSMSGPIDGSVTTTQTSMFPTAALPARQTSAVGVMAGIVNTSANGASTENGLATIEYTNENGVSGKVSYQTVYRRRNGTFNICPLADGDLGVQSVESITLNTALTASAQHHLVLFKPLGFLSIPGLASHDDGMAGGSGGSMAQNRMIGGTGPIIVHPQARLHFVTIPANNSTGITAMGELIFLDK